jgi:hypothetical protein
MVIAQDAGALPHPVAGRVLDADHSLRGYLASKGGHIEGRGGAAPSLTQGFRPLL